MPKQKKIHDKEQTLNICTCGIEAQDDTFIWANLGGYLVLLCWDCSAILHKKNIEEGKEYYG